MQCGRLPKRPLAMATGPTFAVMPQARGPAQEQLAVARDRVRPVRVAVRVAPGPALAGHRQLLLEVLVVGPQVGVVQRPVGADPVGAEGVEVAGVEPGRVAGEVDHRAAHPAAGVVRAQRHRVGSGDDAGLGPVQVVGARLVADPVPFRVPERPGLQRDRRQPARASRCSKVAPPAPQPTMTMSTSSPSAIAAHVAAQPRRRLPGPPAAARRIRCASRTAFIVRLRALRTGSSPGRASRTSNGSRRSTPRFL